MQPTEIKKAAVIGAGVMGHSIAQVMAQGGIETNLIDIDQPKLDQAKVLIKSNLETLSEFGKVPSKEIPVILNRIHPMQDVAAGCSGVDFALEAVNETAEAKIKIFALMEKHCPPNAILASNTSSLYIYPFVKLNNPGRLIVAHWFAPPHIIPLVEIVPGPETSQDTIENSVNLMRKIGKMPMVFNCQDAPPSVINRFLNMISLTLWDTVNRKYATPEEIDLAVKSVFAIRLPIVGVAQMLDFTGLDTTLAITRTYGADNPAIAELVDQGRLGAKSGKGIYDYGGRTEQQILKDRDIKYLKLLDFLEKIDAFKPV
jgi:3-hydroxybutyryl-CoA dehydrogenase